jgi:hypothetical protein
VALVQDRPVLGGNGSSEVRVWPEGTTRVEPFPHVGEIVEEILPDFKRSGMMAGKTALFLAFQDFPRSTIFLEILEDFGRFLGRSWILVLLMRSEGS